MQDGMQVFHHARENIRERERITNPNLIPVQKFLKKSCFAYFTFVSYGFRQ